MMKMPESSATPRVSIVTLSFNQGRFLDRAIRSVVEQDYPNIEYIVVDPGSTDSSREIIARHADRIAVQLLDPDDGPGDGLNKGFACATGDIFGYLNADDALLPGALTEAVAALSSPPSAEVVTGHGYIVDGCGRVLRRFRSARFDPIRHVFGAAIVMQQSTFFTAAAFRATSGFNASNRTCWDAEILLDMAAAGARFKRVDRFWSLFTMHEAGITGSGRLAEQTERDEDMLFEKVMGRARTDRDIKAGQRMSRTRWLGDPVGALQRLRDQTIGPPDPGFTHLLEARPGTG